MLIVGHKKNRSDIFNVFKRWDLEACAIGTVTEDGKYTIVYDTPHKKNVKLPMEFADIFPDVHENWEHHSWKPQKSAHKKATRKFVEDIWHQYDFMVGLRTIKGPNTPGRYAIIDVPEIGKEIVLAWSSDEGLSDSNPKRGVTHAFDACFKRLRSLSATPLGLTNCLNFGHPKDSIGAFQDTVYALKKCAEKRKVPIVGGNVSLYNAHGAHSIKPTPVIVMAGVRNRIR